MKVCAHCGREYGEDYSFCLDDGNVLISRQTSGSHQPTQVIPQITAQDPSVSRWPMVAVAVLLVAVGGLAAALFMRSGENGAGNTLNERSWATPASAGPTPASSREAVPPAGNTAITTGPPAPVVSPAGDWSGDWSAPSGAYLTLDVSLSEASGQVDGQINWTLVRTTRPDKQGKIGSRATEYVRGRFDPATRLVTLAGYRKDDPNNMLVMLDQYRLNLSVDTRSLNGSARNGGKWTGRVRLSR